MQRMWRAGLLQGLHCQHTAIMMSAGLLHALLHSQDCQAEAEAAGSDLSLSLPLQVLAYGQTGSGKTYTMGTTCGKKELASSHPSNPVIPWALQELFKYLGEATKTHEVTLLVRGLCPLLCA